jgi:hypothetical protein
MRTGVVADGLRCFRCHFSHTLLGYGEQTYLAFPWQATVMGRAGHDVCLDRVSNGYNCPNPPDLPPVALGGPTVWRRIVKAADRD